MGERRKIIMYVFNANSRKSLVNDILLLRAYWFKMLKGKNAKNK